MRQGGKGRRGREGEAERGKGGGRNALQQQKNCEGIASICE